MLVFLGEGTDRIVNPDNISEGLFRVQIVIVASLLDELQVSPLLDDLALLNDQDAVGCANGR